MHGLTHVPGGPDPIPGLAKIPSGDTLDAVIAGFDPAGFWKLDDTSGTVAADSSGNSVDLSVDATGVAPAWGAAAGPPGTPAADFQTGTGGLGGTAGRVARSWPPISSSFTAGLFLSRNDTASSYVMGQGDPGRAGGKGWMLALNPDTTVEPHKNRPYVAMIGATTGGLVEATNQLLADVWVFLAAAYDSAAGQVKLYVNGLLQGTSAAFTFAPVTAASPLWIGQDGPGSGTAVDVPRFVGSYAFLVPSVLTGTDLLSIYNTAAIPAGANEGKALLATGLGGTYWDFAVEVSY
jgi:alpha-N-arabinofuranosidase